VYIAIISTCTEIGKILAVQSGVMFIYATI